MEMRELRKKACLSNWFPLIEKSGMPVPKTIIIKTDIKLIQLIDGKTPRGFKDFVSELTNAAETLGLPCFLRTGQTSNKHGWKDSCFIESTDNLQKHIFNLVEFSECVDFIGLDYNVWVLREMLSTEAVFHHWNRLPITKERRYFVQDGKVLCHHPYWYEKAFEGLKHSEQIKLAQLNFEPKEEVKELTGLAEKVSTCLEGAWSVDFLETANGWCFIDAAPAEGSWHHPDCKTGTF